MGCKNERERQPNKNKNRQMDINIVKHTNRAKNKIKIKTRLKHILIRRQQGTNDRHTHCNNTHLYEHR